MKQTKNMMNRRKFLGTASCAALGSGTLLSSILNLGMVNSLAGMNLPSNQDSDYKAVVCILLAGGNDSFNMLVPRNGNFYQQYATTRSNLALPQNDLLNLNFTDNEGRQFGVHPSMPEVQSLFNNNKLAFLSNVGTLVEPTTKDDILNNNVILPKGLLSHADQIRHWQTSIPQSRFSKGWGGRMADILIAGNENQDISMNISLSGTNTFQVGVDTAEYAIRASAGGSVGIGVYEGGNIYDLLLKGAVQNMLEREYQDIFRKTFANKVNHSQQNHEVFSIALEGVPPFNTAFSENPVSTNMELVAKTIAARDALGMSRQTFFIEYGGWDHHDEVLNNQAQMLANLSKGISEFQLAMEELELEEQVTTFTISDFGRTLTSNGNGSDHAWGGNVMVSGGSVNGGEVFGTFPSLAIDGPDDVGGAIMLPTLSTDEYFAELARWFGITAGELDYVLPNITNFYDPNSTDLPIGFLNL